MKKKKKKSDVIGGKREGEERKRRAINEHHVCSKMVEQGDIRVMDECGLDTKMSLSVSVCRTSRGCRVNMQIRADRFRKSI